MADNLERQKQVIRETRDLLNDLQSTAKKFEGGTYFNKLTKAIRDVGDESTLTGKKVKDDLLDSVAGLRDRFNEGKLSADQVAQSLYHVQGAMDGISQIGDKLRDTGITEAAAEMAEKFGEKFDMLGEKLKSLPLTGQYLFDKMDFSSISEKFKGEVGPAIEKIFSGNMVAGMKDLTAAGTQAFKTIMGGVSGMAIGLGVVVGLLILAWNRFVAIDKVMVGIRDNTGLSGDNLQRLTNLTEKTSLNVAKMGIDLEKAAEATTAMANEFSNISLITQQGVETVALMSKTLGLSADEASKLYSTFLNITGGSEDMARRMIETTKAAAELVDVAPQAVFQDIAGASDRIFELTDGLPGTIARTAIEARRLGLNLDSVTGIAEKLMDFEGSIEAQMNAMALTGRQINLEQARYFAMLGETDKMMQEVTKQVGTLTEFEAMLPVQRKAFAEAIGLSTGEMAKMLRTQEQMQKVTEGTMSTFDAFQKGAGMEDVLKSKEALSPLEDLSASFSALVVSLSQVLMPVIKALIPIFKVLATILGFVADVLRVTLVPVVEVLGGMLEGLIDLGIDVVKHLNIFSVVATLWEDGVEGLWQNIIGIFEKYYKNLWESLTKPWIAAWEFLFGNTIWSVDNIMMVFSGIIDVLKTIGGIVFDILVAPWKAAFEIIKEVGSFIGDLLFGEEPTVEVQATQNIEQANAVAAAAADINAATTAPPAGEGTTPGEEQMTINDVVEKLDQLLNALSSGVDLKMDGAKYGEFLAKHARK